VIRAIPRAEELARSCAQKESREGVRGPRLAGLRIE
jgi:hypothetical protein